MAITTSFISFAFHDNRKTVYLALETYCGCRATLGGIKCWTACLISRPFVDAGITISTTSSSAAASDCTAPTHTRTAKGREITGQERTNANGAGLCFDSVYREEKYKQYG